MKPTDTMRLVACAVLALGIATYSPKVESATTILWQTTFNCPDWDQRMGLNDDQVCLANDGISGWGNWTTQNGSVDSITSAANFSGGAGGKGFRAMKGDGVNNQGGSIKISWNKFLPELWVRWYMRYQSGFNWVNGRPSYSKELYFNDALPGNNPIFYVGFLQGGYGVSIVSPGSMNLTGSADWQSVNGGVRGDGRFHAYEVHVKMDTNGSNGLAESWVDGALVHRHTNVNWGGTKGWQGWSFFTVAINQSTPANGQDMYADYDDFALSDSGYIGPIGGVVQPPSAPANLRITN